MSVAQFTFEWDAEKNRDNRVKHGIDFAMAQFAFADSRRIIAEDTSHSASEPRYFCYGTVEGGVVTVRFSFRNGIIRIFGAGYWRKGKRIYERENQVHR